jgi:hypothetical protein
MPSQFPQERLAEGYSATPRLQLGPVMSGKSLEVLHPLDVFEIIHFLQCRKIV